MRCLLPILSLCLAISISAQETQAPAPSLGQDAVHAVLSHYVMNVLAKVPETQRPLPPEGKWSIKTTRPDACPHDDTPCALVIYTVAAAHVVCEWTIIPEHYGIPTLFLNQNEDASRYLLRKLSSAELVPLIVLNPQPIYPAIARAAHIAGDVMIQLVVSSEGNVTSSSVGRGPAMLLGSALQAAKQWSFHAFKVGSQPVPFVADLTAEFILEKETAKCAVNHSCPGSKGEVKMHP